MPSLPLSLSLSLSLSKKKKEKLTRASSLHARWRRPFLVRVAFLWADVCTGHCAVLRRDGGQASSSQGRGGVIRAACKRKIVLGPRVAGFVRARQVAVARVARRRRAPQRRPGRRVNVEVVVVGCRGVTGVGGPQRVVVCTLRWRGAFGAAQVGVVGSGCRRVQLPGCGTLQVVVALRRCRRRRRCRLCLCVGV